MIYRCVKNITTEENGSVIAIYMYVSYIQSGNEFSTLSS